MTLKALESKNHQFRGGVQGFNTLYSEFPFFSLNLAIRIAESQGNSLEFHAVPYFCPAESRKQCENS